MVIEELTPSTNHKYISSKYNNENNVVNAQKLDTPLQAKLDTPPQPALDTNILRVNNLYNVSIERLYSYSINNTHARDLNDKTCVIDCANKNNDINKLAHTDSTEIKTLNTEEKKSGYADLAFGFLTEPTQSACLKFS